MAGEWDVAIAEAARLGLAFMQASKDAKQDRKEGRIDSAIRKEALLVAASDAWDRGDLSACADYLSGVLDIPSRAAGHGGGGGLPLGDKPSG